MVRFHRRILSRKWVATETTTGAWAVGDTKGAAAHGLAIMMHLGMKDVKKWMNDNKVHYESWI